MYRQGDLLIVAFKESIPSNAIPQSTGIILGDTSLRYRRKGAELIRRSRGCSISGKTNTSLYWKPDGLGQQRACNTIL